MIGLLSMMPEHKRSADKNQRYRQDIDQDGIADPAQRSVIEVRQRLLGKQESIVQPDRNLSAQHDPDSGGCGEQQDIFISVFETGLVDVAAELLHGCPYLALAGAAEHDQRGEQAAE